MLLYLFFLLLTLRVKGPNLIRPLPLSASPLLLRFPNCICNLGRLKAIKGINKRTFSSKDTGVNVRIRGGGLYIIDSDVYNILIHWELMGML